MLHGVLLVIHVLAGTAGLALGALALTATKRRGRHTRAGLAYQVVLVALTLSSVGLAALAWERLWWLAAIAVATEAAALAGLWVRRRRFAGWAPWHVRLMCGSYLSLVTALLVVNWGSPLAWVLPTAIGTPLIARAAGHAGRAELRAAGPAV